MLKGKLKLVVVSGSIGCIHKDLSFPLEKIALKQTLEGYISKQVCLPRPQPSASEPLTQM